MSPMVRPCAWFRGRPEAKPATVRLATPPWPGRTTAPNGSHLVDLDAAFGRGSNRELLAEVVGELDVKVELSGGIRDDESLKAALATGCARVNLGTAALEDPQWCARAIAEYGDRVAVGLDVRIIDGEYRLRGPRLGQRRRRSVGGARTSRTRRVLALRGHRRHQGRHPDRAQSGAAAATCAPSHRCAGHRLRRCLHPRRSAAPSPDWYPSGVEGAIVGKALVRRAVSRCPRRWPRCR